MPLRREVLLLVAIVLLGLALRLAAVLAYPHAPESDELAYQSMALGLIHGTGLVDNMGNHAMYNVGYPLFVLAPAFALLGEQLWAARLANLVLGALTMLLCYALAGQAGAGRWGRLFAAAAWALYLPASVYGVYLAKENLMLPLMLGIGCCALRLAARPNWALATGSGLLCGLLALTGNAGLCLVCVLLVALLCCPLAWPRRLALALVMASAATLVVLPWLVRNARVLGAPVLNTNGGFNLYTGNNPAATGWYMSIADTPRGPSWNALRLQGEVQASDILKHEALAWIRAHPAEFTALALKKAGYFWTPPLHPGKGPGSAVERLVRLAWAGQYLLLAVLALASLAVPALRNKKTALLWLALAGYTLVHMLFFVSVRYREPVMPVLVVLAALVFERLAAGWPHARWPLSNRAPTVRPLPAGPRTRLDSGGYG